jgi:hypothetical protein
MFNRQSSAKLPRTINPFLVGPTYHGLIAVLNANDRNPEAALKAYSSGVILREAKALEPPGQCCFISSRSQRAGLEGASSAGPLLDLMF